MATSRNSDNLHHEFRTLSLLLTMGAIVSNPTHCHPQLEFQTNKEASTDSNFLANRLTKLTKNAYHSSVMHAITNILVLNTEVLAAMNHADNRPPADDEIAITDDDMEYHTDVEMLKLAVTPNPDLHRDQHWGVEYKDRGCVRGPSGKSLWDQVKASDRGFYLIDANIR
jgi:hypothetical protein